MSAVLKCQILDPEAANGHINDTKATGARETMIVAIQGQTPQSFRATAQRGDFAPAYGSSVQIFRINVQRENPVFQTHLLKVAYQMPCAWRGTGSTCQFPWEAA